MFNSKFFEVQKLQKIKMKLTKPKSPSPKLFCLFSSTVIFPRLLQAGWANFQFQSSDRVVLLVNSFFKILLQINGKQF